MKRKTPDTKSGIADLKKLVSLTKKSFKDSQMLLKSLDELDKLIEMDSLKESIVEMINLLIVKRTLSTKDEQTMLHISICGPPGVGKTTTASILGRILLSMGLVEKRTSDPTIAYKSASEYLSESSMDILSIAASLSNMHTIIEKLGESYSSDEEADEDEEEEQRTYIYKHDWKSLRKSVDTGINSSSTMMNRELVKKIPPREPTITIGTRESFVGQYVGETAIKTRKFLDECLGGILIIDEAYSLINSERDSFGAEALTIINEYMSLYPKNLIVIFCGYRELMDKTIFTVQPGLKRRITWSFDAPGYSPVGLAQIFRFQAEKEGWTIDPSMRLDYLFIDNKNSFSSFGGDTLKLLLFSRISHAKSCVSSFLSMRKKGRKIVSDTILKEEHIKEAFERLVKSKPEQQRSSILDQLYL